MRPNQQNPVHSPYVVVLGGNSVRRKGISTPPPDASEYHDHSRPGLEEQRHTTPEKPDAPQVYGILPPLVSMKTMAQDLQEVKSIETLHHTKKVEVKPLPRIKKWWNFAKKEAKEKKENITPHQNTGGLTLGESALPVVSASRVIDVPSEADRARPSPYRSRFMRGVAKKGYLTSKLAVELPFHAKVGFGIALLVLIVGVPVASRFIAKPAPVTAGTVVALGTDALVAQVGKSIALPEGETPLVVLATADDIRRLNVPESKPGNKVLIYQNAGKIVVYDAEGDTVLGVVNRAQP